MALNVEQFQDDGVIVVRGIVNPILVEAAQKEWQTLRLSSRPVNRFNPVEVAYKSNALESIAESLKHLVFKLLGAMPRVYNTRLVVKDNIAKQPVFLHQDSCYHIGSMPKLSAFVALSSICPENGGLRFWLGTHKYGYLGDAGEIDPQILETPPKVICPVLAPGDVAFMNSHLWHDSGPRIVDMDRVYADIIFQRSDEPAIELNGKDIFRNCRVKKLSKMEARIRELEEVLRLQGEQ